MKSQQYRQSNCHKLKKSQDLILPSGQVLLHLLHQVVPGLVSFPLEILDHVADHQCPPGCMPHLPVALKSNETAHSFSVLRDPPSYSCLSVKKDEENSLLDSGDDDEEDALIGLATLRRINRPSPDSPAQEQLSPDSPAQDQFPEISSSDPSGSSDTTQAHSSDPALPRKSLRLGLKNIQAPLRILHTGGQDGGPTWSYKPWTRTELLSVVKGFPRPRENPTKFAEEFLLVCDTYEPSEADLLQLCKLLTPSEHEKWLTAANWLAADCHSTLPDTGPNAEYRKRCKERAKNLFEAIPRVWTPKTNWMAINGCKRRQGENPSDYRSRLTDIFLQHSGIQQPDKNGQGALANAFVNGLLPAVGNMLKRISVGWETETMDKLQTVAEHCQRTLKGKEEQSAQQLMALQIQHYSGQGKQYRGRGKYQGRGRGRGRGRGTGFSGYGDVCNYCKQPGHWKNECPSRPNNSVNNQLDPLPAQPVSPQPYFVPQQ
ncbi:uncharacterized protein LOC122174001 isoform X2 [Chrysemys picta bellii]|uniref:uncharacterized protein LOC122174001 isoform X2 n=1 Tax=Chrysemys picta bellii TaxID=8478 RepID=UPI0032B12746